VDGGHTSMGSKIRLEIVCSRWAQRGENHSQTDLAVPTRTPLDGWFIATLLATLRVVERRAGRSP
jgi:hypothetical protein